jgi:hypothetical protein
MGYNSLMTLKKGMFTSWENMNESENMDGFILLF